MIHIYLLLFSTASICEQKDKKKKYEPPIPTRVGKKKKKTKGPDAASKLPLGMKLRKQWCSKGAFQNQMIYFCSSMTLFFQSSFGW